MDYHEKEYPFDTDFTLSGDIEEIFVTQNSLSDYSAAAKLRIAVTSNGKKVFGRTFSSTLGKTTVPSPGVNTKVLTELLQGLMRELVPELRDSLKQ